MPWVRGFFVEVLVPVDAAYLQVTGISQTFRLHLLADRNISTLALMPFSFSVRQLRAVLL
jgi:hypothetical protein